jgi:hypothetical protein
MVAAGVFIVDGGATQAVVFLLGTGLMVMGALLPRLSGTIRISPGSLEMTVIQQLEATRREAEQHLPDRVDEAVGLAFQRLVQSGAIVGAVTPGARTSEEPSPEPPRAARHRGLPWRLVPAGLAALLLFFVVGGVLVLPGGESPPEPADRPPAPTLSPSGDNAWGAEEWFAAGAITVAVVVAVAGLAILVSRRRRSAVVADGSAPQAEADRFARRIIEEMGAKS